MMMELRDHPESGLSFVLVVWMKWYFENEDSILNPFQEWNVILKLWFRLGNMDIPGLAMSRSLGDTVAHTGLLKQKRPWKEQKDEETWFFSWYCVGWSLFFTL